MNEVTPKNTKDFKQIIAFTMLVVVAASLWVFLANSKKQRLKDEAEIGNLAASVGADFVKKQNAAIIENYQTIKEDIAFGKKSQYDLCVAAREISANFKENGNQSEFEKWNKIRETDCNSRAGVK